MDFVPIYGWPARCGTSSANAGEGYTKFEPICAVVLLGLLSAPDPPARRGPKPHSETAHEADGWHGQHFFVG